MALSKDRTKHFAAEHKRLTRAREDEWERIQEEHDALAAERDKIIESGTVKELAEVRAKMTALKETLGKLNLEHIALLKAKADEEMPLAVKLNAAVGMALQAQKVLDELKAQQAQEAAK